MTTINNIPTRADILFKSMESTATAPLSKDQVKPAPVDAIVAQALAQPHPQAGLFQTPELSAPSNEGWAKVTTHKWLQKTLEDKSFKEPAGTRLNTIVGLAEEQNNLIGLFSKLMLSLVKAENQTTQRNIILGSKLAVMRKESVNREASSGLGGAIGGAVVAISLSAGGTFMSGKGADMKINALKNNKVKVNQLSAELKENNSILDSHGRCGVGQPQEDALNHLELRPAPTAATPPANRVAGGEGVEEVGVAAPAHPADPDQDVPPAQGNTLAPENQVVLQPQNETVARDGVANNNVQLAPSNPQLSEEHREILKASTKQLEGLIAEQDHAFQTNTLRGSRLETKGNAVAGASHAASAIAQGGGNFAATTERGVQTVEQAGQQLANTAAQGSSERERDMRNMGQDLLHTMASIAQNTNTTNSEIAGSRMA
ncbi:IpaC/SipC family type III secretion system effector [Chromobacterium amazonense]|uniref:IpaC/SipC family type III secretion system effector n=1 Tax=Chromobacterium amazonense TaxID=1382803 RepID=UPI003F7B0A5A